MAFKKLRSIRLPYAKQGQIYFALLNYRTQPKKVQERIDRLIHDAANGEKEYEAALREWLIDDERWDKVIQKHYLSDKVLITMRKKVYENWDK